MQSSPRWNHGLLTERRRGSSTGGLNDTSMNAKFAKMESRSPYRAAHEQEPRHRPCRKICLLCLVTSVLVAIVAGLSIHVLQIRQSLLASDQKYQRLWEQHQEMNRTQRQCRLQIHEPNSTLESITSENSRFDISQITCLKNISVQNNNVSIIEHNLNHLELKCKTLNETKAQICQLLTSRKEFCERTCPRPRPFILDWNMQSGVRFGVMHVFGERLGSGISLVTDTCLWGKWGTGASWGCYYSVVSGGSLGIFRG
ncbi:uncharacterized protein [Hemitrygon akajei]|uniref:uncharacterized protein isoform X2 n=1 Tax=Hemitrygon akajei TaxID=2704970 RepID=UPI003BFA36D4